jgi:hypothetical protein
MLKKYVILLLTISIFLAQKTTAMEQEKSSSNQPGLSPAARLITPQDLVDRSDNESEAVSTTEKLSRNQRRQATWKAEQDAQKAEVRRLQNLLSAKEQELRTVTDTAQNDRRTLEEARALLNTQEQEFRTATQLLRDRNDSVSRLEANLTEATEEIQNKDAQLERQMAYISLKEDESQAHRVVYTNFKRFYNGKINSGEQALAALDQSMNQRLLKAREEFGKPSKPLLNQVFKDAHDRAIQTPGDGNTILGAILRSPALTEDLNLLVRASFHSHAYGNSDAANHIRRFIAHIALATTQAYYAPTAEDKNKLETDLVEARKNTEIFKKAWEAYRVSESKLQADLAEERKTAKIFHDAWEVYKANDDKKKEILQKVYDRLYTTNTPGIDFVIGNVPIIGPALLVNDGQDLAKRLAGLRDLVKTGL